jgi:ACT domain-containing protein
VIPPANRIYITVLGTDRIGIVARIATLLSERRVNIADINQKIIDGIFTMVLIAEMDRCTVPLESLKEELEAVGKDLGLTVALHHEAVFQAMHRI